MSVIKPTVGRVVLFWPQGRADRDAGGQPCAATVAYVHSDRMVNLGYVNHNGDAAGATSVKLLQPGDPIPDVDRFCEWMPYQVGQAQKAEELQRKLDQK